MRTTIRLTSRAGNHIVRVLAEPPIVDITGSLARVRVWEQPFERYFACLTVGSSNYVAARSSPQRALVMALQIYRELKPAGPPTVTAIRDDLVPLLKATDDLVDPKDREVLD